MQSFEKVGRFWRNPWRLAGWGLVITLLLIPLIAMNFSVGVNWTGSDFVVAAVLLGGTGMLIELGCRYGRSVTGRAGWILVALTSLLLIWINMAVGIIGSEDNPANLLYLVVLASLVVGALWVRFRPKAMSYVLLLTATLQIGVELVIRLAELGTAPILNAAFALLWLLAAGLLRYADAAIFSSKSGSGA